MRQAFVPAALCAALLASAAPAATLDGFTSAWFFGDSLSDDGNLYAATGGAVPASPPYYDGRRSNGPVWAEHVAAGYTARGLATENFAYVGAHALEYDDPSGFRIPDLPDQIAAFGATATGSLGENPVAALWIGANDVLTAITPNATPEGIVSIARNAALAVGAGIEALHGYGVDSFVVLNLPALDLTPAFALAAPAAAPLAKLGTDVYNATLASVLAGLGSGVEVALGCAACVSTEACVTSKTEVCINCSMLGVGGSSAGVGVGVGGTQAEIIPMTMSNTIPNRRRMDKL